MTGFNEVEERYIDAVSQFLTAEQESHAAGERSKEATAEVRAQFATRVEGVVREAELVHAAVDRSVGADSHEGELALKAADTMVKVEEAVANGMPRHEATLRALLGGDPRTSADTDPFEGVSLSDL